MIIDVSQLIFQWHIIRNTCLRWRISCGKSYLLPLRKSKKSRLAKIISVNREQIMGKPEMDSNLRIIREPFRFLFRPEAGKLSRCIRFSMPLREYHDDDFFGV